MNAYVALLRALNVGGTGKLPMAELRALCTECGFSQVSTYIQSGNVVFSSELSEAQVKATLEQVLSTRMGKPASVLIRTAEQLRDLLEHNPFPDAAPNKVLVLFLDEPPQPGLVVDTPIPGREELQLRGRELFIHFPDGMGRSKLKVPLQKIGTGRNLNTTRKLAAMVHELADAIASSG